MNDGLYIALASFIAVFFFVAFALDCRDEEMRAAELEQGEDG